MRNGASNLMVATASTVALVATTVGVVTVVEAKLADRSRIVQARQSSRGDSYHDNGLAIEGQAYRTYNAEAERSLKQKRTNKKKIAKQNSNNEKQLLRKAASKKKAPWMIPADIPNEDFWETNGEIDTSDQFERKTASQLSGCCYDYEGYSADTLCAMYGQDCESGETPSHDSGDDDCSHDGLSFIGISFSVNTASSNPFSFQLCDQFPMENIIDRDYEYVMSMDEDGWLVGGGYKTFDYSGKMPYIDSSHTELLRIGNMDPNTGGTSIEQVYEAMSSISFDPIAVFPEYLKGGGGHHSGDDDGDGGVPSSDVTLIVSVVESYADDDSYSSYEKFLYDLFTAMDNVGGGPCMDDRDTDPHVSMARGVKFWSSYHQQQYMYETNLEVAVWQAMYPYGVVIGSSGSASFPPGRNGRKQYVGYGNLYFFFDRANITKAFAPNRGLTDDEAYYSTLYSKTDTSDFYSSTTSISFDYSGSGDGDDNDYEHNPYGWSAEMANHDFTDGWDLPPNCYMEGETFFGIPLSRSSESKLQSTSSFQEQFDFEYLVDRNNTYIDSFGTNHGWLVGEEIGNAVGSIVDKDTAHIPIFYMGTTNPALGGMTLSNMIKVAQHIDFGKLYIKPAFVFVDQDGHVKLQFEVDTTSALAYLYDAMCKELGISWNGDSPSNNYGLYTNCAMHSAGDRASYGCGPDGGNYGGFCPQMTIAYSPRFQSEDAAAAYLANCNNYIDYWRDLYPNGVAVGTNNFCADGGCMGLFLNRHDLYNVFKPDLGGSWVEYGGASLAPTISPAPTWTGGCDEPHNFHLDRCFRKNHKIRASAVAWDALGAVGQFTVMLVVFMSLTLSISVFITRARKKRRKGESYLGFFFRDLTRRKKKKKKGRRKVGDGELEEDMLDDNRSRSSRKSRRRSKSSSGRSRRSSRSRSKSRRSKSKTRSSRSAKDESIQPNGSDAASQSGPGLLDFSEMQPQGVDEEEKKQRLV